MSRFDRHHLIDCFDQDRLLGSRILVVGAGAIGNEVLKNLALLGVGTLHILDPDRIEESNLTRSVLFRAGHIGQPKAEVAAGACTGLFPGGRFTWTQGDFWTWASIDRLRGFDAVVAATDNYGSRLQLNQLCRLAPVDLFNAGIDSRHVTIEAFPFRTDPSAACYECTLPSSAYQQARERYSCAGLRHTAERERRVPTTAITASHAGAGLAGALLNSLNRHPDRPTGAFRQRLDTVNPRSGSTLAIGRSPTCPTCSGGEATVRVAAGPDPRSWPQDAMAADAGDLTLSNPVLLGTCCRLCGERREIVAPADAAGTSLLRCARCGRDGALADIRDQLSPADLSHLPDGTRLPIKYASFIRHETLTLIEINHHEHA